MVWFVLISAGLASEKVLKIVDIPSVRCPYFLVFYVTVNKNHTTRKGIKEPKIMPFSNDPFCLRSFVGFGKMCNTLLLVCLYVTTFKEGRGIICFARNKWPTTKHQPLFFLCPTLPTSSWRFLNRSLLNTAW